MTEPTRRDFLKTSSAAAVLGASFLQGVSNRAFADGSDEIKIGLVGCGGRGTGAAAQALQTAGKVKLTAMGDVFPESIENSLRTIQKEVSGKPDAEVDVEQSRKFVGFDAYKQVVDSGVDLVVLATPPGLRPFHFEYAVAQGKNVFMEKPVAVDGPGVQRVLDASRIAKEKGLKVGVGLQRHHQKPYVELIGRLHAGEFGDVRMIRTYWNSGGVWEPRVTRDQVKSEMEYQVRNWYYYNWLCGDHIVEQHIHNLDVGNWVMKGYPVSANGMGGREVRKDPKYGEIYDHHACEFTYADGTVMVSQCRHIKNCWNSVSEHIHTTKGIINFGGQARVDLFDGSKSERVTGGGNPYQIEHDALFSAIRKGEAYSEADNGAMSTMTAILGRMCTYSGKEIKMEDALKKGLQVTPNEFSWDATPPTVPGPDGYYPIPIPGVTQVLKA